MNDSSLPPEKKQLPEEETAPEESTPPTFPLVGIGTSAGGLAALKKFFAHVPPDTGMAYVVVVHLAPDHKSHLAEILQPHVSMPVTQVTETVPLDPNHVYVIPPNANLDTIDTHLRLTELEPRRRERAPIDHFLRNLAKTHQEAAVGVILTGTGSDGTLGLREIKQAGGFTIVQSPNEAEFDGMPQSAIAGNQVDFVLPLAEIPHTILRCVRTQPKVPYPIASDLESGEAEPARLLQKVFAQVRVRTGQDFSRYKTATLFRRITRRMQLAQIEELGDYVELLRNHADEVRALAEDMLITVTSFFRDPEVFQKLEESIIPEIFAGKGPDDEIRVWTVGCATGEEAYSLAILLMEHASRLEFPPRIQVFASDLHERSLKTAREGFYPGDIETDVSPERIKRFFHKVDSGYRVRKEVRELVIFAGHNLLADPPFSRIDLISCRNLLIYVQRNVQAEIIALFHYALKPQGYLLLGSSETIESAELFREEDKKSCIYRKRNVPGPEPRLPVFPVSRSRPSFEEVTSLSGSEPMAFGAFHQRMVERYAPPSMLLSPDDKVVHLSENAGHYFVYPGGEMTTNVYKLIREELRVELRSALHAARSEGRSTASAPIWVELEGERKPIVLHVRPSQEAQQEGFALVLFEDRPVPLPPPPGVSRQSVGSQDMGQPETSEEIQIQELEAELQLINHRQQAIIEEYETGQEELRASNEELQSSNEELRSTLEELETSKEELQSMNEELQTVNQENFHKVEELAQLSSDLQNLLAATDIATLFLDRELRILRFTPRVSELFNIRLADRSRPLSDLTHRLGDCDLLAAAEEVLASLVPAERELRDESGRYFLTRILPYRSADDRIEGVVITFIDVTKRRDAEADLLASGERFRNLVEQVQDYAIFMTDVEGRGTSWNNGVKRVLGFEEREFIGANVLKAIFTPEDYAAGIPHQEFDVAAAQGSASNDRWMRRKEGAYFWAAGITTALRDRHGELLGFMKVMRDQTAQKRLEDELRHVAGQLSEANRRKDEFLATLAHELRNPLAPILMGLEVLKTAHEDPETFNSVHRTIERQTKQLVTLVDDLLEISRISRDSFQLRKQRILLDEVIESAVEASQPIIHEAQQQLSIETADHPIRILVDPHRLAQVLSNLLNNAAKYTPEGGQIWLTTKQMQEDIVIKVRDSGRGIPSDKLDEIFEMFTQIERGAEQYAGLGIGLPLAKRLVEMHGGEITVQSEGEGRGSEFCVILRGVIDQDQANETPAPPLARSEDESDRPLKVLVVDDNLDAATILSSLVEHLGHTVRTADDGQRAIEAAAEFRPEVILMDLGMPHMNGYEAAQHIRSQAWGQEMVLVALTGWGQEKDRSRTREAGFNFHLVKPADMEKIREIFAACR